MPVEFLQQEPSGGSSHATCLVMMYDGSGRRISKTLLTRASDSQGWDTTLVTHYTGIGTEIRENYAGPTKQTKVVVNMPVFFRCNFAAEAAKLHRKRHPSAIKWRSHSPEAKLRSLKTGPGTLRYRKRRWYGQGG